MAIPPAWTDVWIALDPRGHLQAVGRDARGRKQYRYHPRWREVRDRTKYERMLSFARALPRIRRRVRRDLAKPGLPREKVLATIVRLLETTFLRIGNAEYAKENESYGLTTLRARHVRVHGPRLRFRFRGKGGRLREVELEDRRLARILRRCQEIPGQELFRYLDDEGEPRSIGSGDVNDYLREISGEDFTAKDFRTWAGTLLAATAFAAARARAAEAASEREVIRVVREVAERLGNTPAVCRKCYIHPVVVDHYLRGGPFARTPGRTSTKAPNGLRAAESLLISILARKRREPTLEETLRRSLRSGRRAPGMLAKPAGS